MFGIEPHKLVVHFPIALALIAVIYDSWAVYSKRPDMHETGYGLTLWAAIGALAAVVSGLDLAGNNRIPKGAVTGHAGWGITSAIVITALAVLRYSAKARERKGYPTVWLILEWAAAGLIGAAAIMGHQL
ncbi:MAG: hypothetical protein HYU27_01405 [Acidobacteria bacterium]|nr:hypothetical protein [Acidobacteriota bacterium]